MGYSLRDGISGAVVPTKGRGLVRGWPRGDPIWSHHSPRWKYERFAIQFIIQFKPRADSMVARSLTPCQGSGSWDEKFPVKS
ncbi:hypothetical protein CEXT_683651 [Caerostris extrusa]|uniref:Uncharacterized protein n=1 Tax=Caerostris extrusa TaxID=172846 RepID=A0AAV4PZK4_CAEEX|nr:hypothetical protein CEXT_683651 [Caerostris extrusa]